MEASSIIGDIKRKVFIAPVFLMKNLFFLGTVVLIGVIDPTICIANLGAYLFTNGFLFALWRYLTGGTPGENLSFNNSVYMLYEINLFFYNYFPKIYHHFLYFWDNYKWIGMQYALLMLVLFKQQKNKWNCSLFILSRKINGRSIFVNL